MQKSDIAGNQQARPVSKFELGYVMGLIDGEGSIYAKGWLQRGKDLRVEPYVCLLSNTDKTLMEKAKDIYERLGIAFHIETRQLSKKTTDGKKYLPVWSFKVRGLKRCRRVLKIIIPHLIAKKEQARLLLEFCEKRLTRPVKCGPNGKYDEDELDLVRKVKELNRSNAKYSLSRFDLILESPNDYTPGVR